LALQRSLLNHQWFNNDLVNGSLLWCWLQAAGD
jgi:hypothetical protein